MREETENWKRIAGTMARFLTQSCQERAME
jgi:hypothetical protein